MGVLPPNYHSRHPRRTLEIDDVVSARALLSPMGYLGPKGRPLVARYCFILFDVVGRGEILVRSDSAPEEPSRIEWSLSWRITGLSGSSILIWGISHNTGGTERPTSPCHQSTI